MREKKILSWWFCRKDGTTQFCADSEPGYIYTTDEPEIIPCQSGLHGSEHPMDALQYASGPVLCRVRQWGEVVYHGNPVDKLASRHREILWRRDISRELRLYACQQVRKVMHLAPGSEAVIVVAERFARGEATEEELASARASARDSPWASAWASACDSAWASACDSAWDSAWARASDWDSTCDSGRADFLAVCTKLDREMRS
jgi:hypothetical protein